MSVIAVFHGVASTLTFILPYPGDKSKNMKNSASIACLLVVFGTIYSEAATTARLVCSGKGSPGCYEACKFKMSGHMNDDGKLLLDEFLKNLHLSIVKHGQWYYDYYRSMYEECIPKANMEGDECAVGAALLNCVPTVIKSFATT